MRFFKMNKIVKFLVISIGTLLLFAIIIFAIILIGFKYSDYQVDRKVEEFSKNCDTVSLVYDKIPLNLTGFAPKEIESITFKIIRDNKITKDTLIKISSSKVKKNESVAINIPFNVFLKTDSILFITKNNLHYYISGFSYEPSLKYYGPHRVESLGCNVVNSFKINNRISNCYINKSTGWLSPEKSKKIKYIDDETTEYKKFTNKCKINPLKAQQLFFSQCKKNHGAISTHGIEIDSINSYYIYSEEDYSKLNYTIVKINTKTGEIKRYNDYPFN